MRYIFQHTKELIITLGVFISAVLVIAWSAAAIIRNELSYENVVALIGIVFEMLGWYYNMPTSEENCRHTGAMRLEKEQQKIITGENFFDEAEEIEEEE